MLTSGDYAVRSDRAMLERAVIEERASQRVVTSIKPPAGWHYDDMLDTGRHLIVVFMPDELTKTSLPLVRRYTYTTGEASDLTTAAGLPRPGVPPVWKVSGATVAYSTRRGSDNCLAIADADTLRGRVVECAPRGHYLHVTDLNDTTVTYLRFRKGGCSQLFSRDLRSGRRTELPSVTRCQAFRGASLDGGVVWQEQDPATDIRELATLHARGPRGEQLPPDDRSAAGTLTTCNGWFYWNSQPRGEITETRRWRPGSRVEVVYRTPDDYTVTSAPTCAGRQLHLSRVNGAGADEQQLITANIPQPS
jgi:hypothetical protein